jgi:hypothetical protein
MSGQYPISKMNAGKAKRLGNSAWQRLVIAGGLIAWMAVNFSWAQVLEQKIWPLAGKELWCWIDPITKLAPEQANATFNKAAEEEMTFLDPSFSSTVFFAKNIRLTKGKAGERKKYKDQPEKADDIRIEAEWRTGDMNQYRGWAYRFIALDSIRSMDLWYVPDLQESFFKVPQGRNWNVNIHAGSLYSLFFRAEDSARNFINAVASTLKQRGMNIIFSRFGLMWENVTPAQAADMGKPNGESVLITKVAIAGPADQAGIRPLDVILEVNGTKVKNFSHFSQLLDGIPPRASASLVLLRRLKDPNLYPEQNAWDTLTVEMEAR